MRGGPGSGVRLLGSHGEPMRAGPTPLCADIAEAARSSFYSIFLQGFLEKMQGIAESHSEQLCTKLTICLESEKFSLLDHISRLYSQVLRSSTDC